MNVANLIIAKSPHPNIRLIARYLKFVNCYCQKDIIGYSEKHHILPRSFGGTDDLGNIVKLPARAHYIAHLILARATRSPKMIKALHKMVHSKSVNRTYKITSKVYAYLKAEHAKIVSQYSKGTVVAKHIYTEEISRIPANVFHKYNGILYVAVNKGRKDTESTLAKKRNASKRSRNVRIGLRSRSIAASKYSYFTPRGFCENSTDLLKLYPSFTKNTLTVITDHCKISKKFASIHLEFRQHVGKTFAEIGFKRITHVKNKSK